MLFAFCNQHNQGEYQHLAITSNDMKKVNVVLALMLDLERIQKTLGGESGVTGSLIHPVIIKAKEMVNKIGSKQLALPGILCHISVFQEKIRAE